MSQLSLTFDFKLNVNGRAKHGATSLPRNVNQRIDAARQFKSASYMAGIDVDRLKKPFSEVEQALGQWVTENMHNAEYQPKRRGLFGQ